jgi:hypothetical protein
MQIEGFPEIETEGKRVNLQVEILPPDTYTYSNISSVSITPWDLRLNFGDFNPDEIIGTESKKIKATAGITLPAEHAAGLLVLLMQQLQLFEAQFGLIRHPKWQEMRRNALANRKTAPPPEPPPGFKTE